MSLERAKEHLKKYNMDNRIINLPLSTATVLLAAKALGCEEGRIAKSLSFKLSDKYIVIVMSGDVKIDNFKYKLEFQQKAKMVSNLEVEEKIGHPVGGVCPFALNEGVYLYLDKSLQKYKTVYPACGLSNNAIEISIDELEKITGYIKWIDVCKNK